MVVTVDDEDRRDGRRRSAPSSLRASRTSLSSACADVVKTPRWCTTTTNGMIAIRVGLGEIGGRATRARRAPGRLRDRRRAIGRRARRSERWRRRDEAYVSAYGPLPGKAKRAVEARRFVFVIARDHDHHLLAERHEAGGVGWILPDRAEPLVVERLHRAREDEVPGGDLHVHG